MGEPAKKSAVLTVCGLGIDRPSDTPIGTIQTLKECDVLFYIHGDGKRLEPFLRTFCADVRVCSGPKYDRLTSERKLAAVAAEVCAELKKGRKTAYVTYGHPLLFSDGYNMVKLCRAKGYASRVLPATSAVDSLSVSFSEQFDLMSSNFVVCLAYDALQKPAVFRLGWPVVLFCLDALVEQGLFGALCDQLESVGYPLEHPFYVLKCADGESAAQRMTGVVTDLRNWEKKISHMMSLVVAPY